MRAKHAPYVATWLGLFGGPVVLVVNQDLSACSAVSAVKAVRRCHSAFRTPRSALRVAGNGARRTSPPAKWATVASPGS